MSWHLSDCGYNIDGTDVVAGCVCRSREKDEELVVVERLTSTGVDYTDKSGVMHSAAWAEFAHKFCWHASEVSYATSLQKRIPGDAEW